MKQLTKAEEELHKSLKKGKLKNPVTILIVLIIITGFLNLAFNIVSLV